MMVPYRGMHEAMISPRGWLALLSPRARGKIGKTRGAEAGKLRENARGRAGSYVALVAKHCALCYARRTFKHSWELGVWTRA